MGLHGWPYMSKVRVNNIRGRRVGRFDNMSAL